MCCRYYILPRDVEWDPIREEAEHARVMRRFRAAGAGLVASGEARPTDVVPVLASDRSGGRSFFPMRWGFRLEGAKPSLLINARVETAAQKPSFREAWIAHRCAVPASGYYEWERRPPAAAAEAPPPSGKRAPAVKYAISDPEQPILWLCGLYRIENGLPVFVILTREPGEALARIHDRMPLILPEQAVRAWVDPTLRPEELLPLALTGLAAARAG